MGRSASVCRGKAGRPDRRRPWRWPALLLLCALFLVGCHTTDLLMDDAYNSRVTWGRHVVSSGETLSGIARRYGWDYRQLAAANDLSSPYTLQPGQIIRLDQDPGRQTASQSSTPQSTPPRSRSGSPPVATRSPSATESAGKTRSADRQSGTADNKKLQSGESAADAPNWQWPHLGPIIAKFSHSGDMNKGVDIGGDEGDPVKAAAAGNVVYAGSGLLGYGKLIIVNHNSHYLSAYAHNRAILVSEGDQVTQGQQIAEMGDTGTNRVKLHFEIRKNGDPVDPQQYLPKR